MFIFGEVGLYLYWLHVAEVRSEFSEVVFVVRVGFGGGPVTSLCIGVLRVVQWGVPAEVVPPSEFPYVRV